MDAKRRARRALIGRLLVGHFASYPMMFFCAASSMSLSIVARGDALEAALAVATPRTGIERWLVAKVGLAPPEAATFVMVMQPVLGVLAVVFVVSHLAAIPWARAAARAAVDEAERAAERRGAKRFFATTASATGIVVAVGLVGWIYILTR
jgi:hypothetical protein